MPANNQRQLSLPIGVAEASPRRKRAAKIAAILRPGDEHHTPLDCVLTTREVVKITGRHRVTLYRWMRAGIFPRKHEARGHPVGWLRSDIERWLQGSRPPA